MFGVKEFGKVDHVPHEHCCWHVESFARDAGRDSCRILGCGFINQIWEFILGKRSGSPPRAHLILEQTKHHNPFNPAHQKTGRCF